MKIALINENSQAAKNSIIFEELNNEAKKAGHVVHNYGMFSAEDEHQLTYVQNGLLASILLTTKAVGIHIGKAKMKVHNGNQRIIFLYSIFIFLLNLVHIAIKDTNMK